MQRKKNPFNLSFGRKPFEFIDRFEEESIILNTFTEMPVTDQVYVIMGVRGAGKTVAMTDIAEKIRAKEDWIVIKISPMDDILDTLFRTLCNDKNVKQICIEANLDISVLGVNVSVKTKKIERSLNDAIRAIMEEVSKKDKKVLIAIDEVTNTPQMRAFASAFQMYITDNLPLYFLATALFEEMDALRNVKNLTFLYRAPRLYLSPLNIGAIAHTYRRVFGYPEKESLKMAKLTKGYPFAFQTLGYVVWNNKKEPFLSEDIVAEYDQRLAEASYNKLWSELSENDRNVLSVIAEHEGGRTKEFREKLGMTSNYFNQYRRRLKEHGLINVAKYGCISFMLPRFKEFVVVETGMMED